MIVVFGTNSVVKKQTVYKCVSCDKTVNVTNDIPHDEEVVFHNGAENASEGYLVPYKLVMTIISMAYLLTSEKYTKGSTFDRGGAFFGEGVKIQIFTD